MVESIDLAPLIDHTVLRPEATREDVERACAEAREYGFAGVCVRVEHVALVAKLLSGIRSRPISVVGFPSGTVGSDAKVAEARQAIAAGAQEIDMVIDLAALHRRDYAAVLRDLQAVVEAVQPHGVKAILETGAFRREQKAIAGCPKVASPRASFGTMAELSQGKDTTTGHWEMIGVVLDKGFTTFPHGFPPELMHEWQQLSGAPGFLGNKPASGTVIIEELGREH